MVPPKCFKSSAACWSCCPTLAPLHSAPGWRHRVMSLGGQGQGDPCGLPALPAVEMQLSLHLKAVTISYSDL